MHVYQARSNGKIIVVAVLAMLLGACQGLPQSGEVAAAESDEASVPVISALKLNQEDTLATILPELAKKRVVFVGESHDQYHHHLAQLAVIEGLYARNPALAIGLEFFQQPFQSVLDAYIAGEIDEQAVLEQSEYFDRWRFDYRLYQPILQFARANKIPLIALNLSKEITRQVGKSGLASLTEAQRAQIPEVLDRDIPGYRERIESAYSAHPGSMKQDFENFFAVQLLWDEGMAARAAKYLRAHPADNMVILAGVGHIEFGTGIPLRLKRQLDVEMATVVQGDHVEIRPQIADFVLYPELRELPDSGLIGVMLGPAEQGMKVNDFAENSAGEQAGIQKNDRIIQLNERKINQFGDIRLELWNRKPGEKVQVSVMRDAPGQPSQRYELEIELR